MTNWYQEALQDMETGLINSVSSPVVYKRGEIEIDCDAVFADTEFEAEDYNGFVVEYKVFDFLILVADLSITPQPGDFITYSGVDYEVVTIRNEPCYQYTTPYRHMYRIHTKEYK